MLATPHSLVELDKNLLLRTSISLESEFVNSTGQVLLSILILRVCCFNPCCRFGLWWWILGVYPKLPAAVSCIGESRPRARMCFLSLDYCYPLRGTFVKNPLLFLLLFVNIYVNSYLCTILFPQNSVMVV